MADFSKVKTIHFVGVGGIGISAIARMFLLQGKSVSGSDVAESEITEGLRKLGAMVFLNQRSDNIPTDCDLVIYTIAVTPDNSEFAEAKRRGLPTLSYPEVLGLISKDKYTIAISGTHGKTTTTAMIAKIMIDAGLDPTVIVGSFLQGSTLPARPKLDEGGDPEKGRTFETNFITGKSKYLVVEACEYRRSFLNLHPKILVITNIDTDHLDYYKDLDDIKSAFTELTAKLPADGVLVNDFDKVSLPLGFKLKIPGRHNISNAKAALAVAKALKIPEEKTFKSLAEFQGTWRRFEYRGKASSGAVVYDDYGHHPHEIEATLQGARELFPTQKIMVVFQPHLYSRTKDHLAGLGACFKGANEVVLLTIYPAREIDPGDINSEMVVAEIKKNGQAAHFVKTFVEAAKKSSELAGVDGVIITMGAGETNKVSDILVK